MKIRNGFVSNSSTSSFIVEKEDWRTRNRISEDQINLLIGFGFKATNNTLDQIDANGEVNVDISGYNLGYYVICNENEVIDFLVENKIPFNGLTHYGNNAVLYDGINEPVYIQNEGNIALTYGIEHYNKWVKK